MGTTELLIVLAIVLLVFGAGKLPQIGDSLGRSIKNFKKAAQTGEDEEIEVSKKSVGDGGKRDALKSGDAQDVEIVASKTGSKAGRDKD